MCVPLLAANDVNYDYTLCERPAHALMLLGDWLLRARYKHAR